jgi:hypothetical protein
VANDSNNKPGKTAGSADTDKVVGSVAKTIAKLKGKQ